AAFVGLLNTLVVAVLGCITATVIGVVVGVLRLSDNWLIARLMTVYVEIFRNVPVLLWIVFTMAVMIETLPRPRAFKGDTPSASLKVFDSIAATNQGIFVPRPVPSHYAWILVLTIILSIAAIRYFRRRADAIQEATGDRPKITLLSLGILVVPTTIAFLAISFVTTKTPQSFVAVDLENAMSVTALADAGKKVNYCHSAGTAASLNGLRYLRDNGVKVNRKQYFNRSTAEDAIVEGKCNIIVTSASNAEDYTNTLSSLMKTDTAIQIIQADFFEGRAVEVEIPALAPQGISRFEGGVHLRNSLIALWLALSLYTATFIAEIVRSGILAISQGQTEAAAALGIRQNKIMSLVVLPQALRVIIPPLISQYLNLTKNSSLAIAVGYMDITGTLGGITLNQTGRELECILMLMLVYLAISLSISAVMNWYNESVKLKER
ncbi:MAG: general L-amino acid transport system permease protein, partial [Paracoccaceae bacterium]